MGKIISFYGSDHRVGTSMMSQCAAERLALRFPDRQILLVHAEGRGCTGFSAGVSESMERIRPYLAERVIDPCEILEKARWRGNLAVIGGVSSPCSNYELHPDMACFFFEAMAGVCDLLVSDSGCEIERGIALGSLLSAQRIFVVLAQRESAIRRFEWLRDIYDRLEINMDRYVLNEYDKKSLFTEDYLCERLKLPKDSLFTVRRSSYGIEAEIEEKALIHYRDAGFLKDIDALAEEIGHEL